MMESAHGYGVTNMPPTMLLQESELAARRVAPEDGPGAPARLHLRPDPLRVRWALADLVAKDGHDVRLAFTCSVRALPDPTERRMLDEVLLRGHQRLTDQDVVEHFRDALRGAAAKVVEQRAGTELIADTGRAELTEALRAAAGRVAFACGLEVLPPFSLDAESPSLQQQRLRAMQRELAEQHAAGQVEHFQRAADLLKQFQSIRQGAPDLSAGHVLERINPADRGMVLQTLLLASAKQRGTATLYAVAGPYLVRIERSSSGDGAARGAQPHLTPLPPTLGPLRSVQPATINGAPGLLVGARSGFLVVDPSNPDAAEAYADPGVGASQLGFNEVAYLSESDTFVASHGDGGLVFWSRGDSKEPARAVRPAELPRSDSPTTGNGSGGGTVPTISGTTRSSGPRNLQSLDGTSALFSVGNRVALARADGGIEPVESQSRGEVVAIVPTDRAAYLVHDDGTVCTFDRSKRQVTCTERRGTRLTAAAALPWLDGVRLLLAGKDGPIQCVGVDDPLVTQYASVHTGVRIVTAAPDTVAAVSADRQRLVLWDAWDGRKPAAEVYLAGVARHRIADVSFG